LVGTWRVDAFCLWPNRNGRLNLRLGRRSQVFFNFHSPTVGLLVSLFPCLPLFLKHDSLWEIPPFPGLLSFAEVPFVFSVLGRPVALSFDVALDGGNVFPVSPFCTYPGPGAMGWRILLPSPFTAVWKNSFHFLFFVLSLEFRSPPFCLRLPFPPFPFAFSSQGSLKFF